MAGGGRLRDMLNRGVLCAGVVLGDPDQHRGQSQPDGASAKQFHLAAGGGNRVVWHQPLGDKEKRHQGQATSHCQALVEGGHHVFHAGGGPNKKAANDGGHDRHSAQGQRIDHRARAGVGDQQSAQHHGGNQGHCIGFEQVGGHASAVAHVVSDIVGNHGRIAGIVFWNAGLDFAHKVSTHVCAFGENAAAEPREDGNQ